MNNTSADAPRPLPGTGSGSPGSGSRSPGSPGSLGRPSRSRWTSADLSLIAVFAALTAVFSILPGVPLGAGVPITLQTLAVMLTGMLLGPGRGAAAVGLFLVAGLAGLPVFSGFRGGLGVLAGPSAGYLLSFPVAAAVVGVLSGLVLRRARRGRTVLLFAAGLATSFAVVHPAGIAGLMLNGHLSFPAALAADMAFWPGDVLKNLLAAAVAVSVFKAFPRMAAPDRGAR